MSPPLGKAQAVPARIFYNVKAMFPTELVGYFPKPLMIPLVVLVLPSRAEGNGIDHEMIMYVFGIEMRGNQHFVFISPHPPCRFHTQCVSFLGRDFFSIEALKPVITGIAAELAVSFLCSRHPLIRLLPWTVESGYVHELIRLAGIGGIAYYLSEVVRHILGSYGLLRIDGVIDYS